MKNLLIAAILLFTAPVFGQGDAIEFSSKSFSELKAQAKQENKVIFIDAYTTWCGPCKMMAKNVFTDTEVAETYNSQFINAKIDMEKGEGIDIAQEYGVVAYPTYLFVNGDGELVHRGLGYIPASDFIELGNVAASDDNLLSMKKQYEAGNNDPAFLEKYATILSKYGDKSMSDKVISKYLDTQDDWSEPSVIKMVLASPGELGGKRADFLIENSETILKEVSSDEYMNKVQMLTLMDYMRKNPNQEAMPGIEVLKSHYQDVAAPIADRLTKHFGLMIAQQSSDPSEYFTAATEYYSTYPSNSSFELNSIAWSFFEDCDNEEQLKQAIEWAKRSVKMRKGYANMDTLAWLYHKTGQAKLAKKTAKEAIEIAKKNGEDYSGTTEILNK